MEKLEKRNGLEEALERFSISLERLESILARNQAETSPADQPEKAGEWLAEKKQLRTALDLAQAETARLTDLNIRARAEIADVVEDIRRVLDA